MDFKYPPMSNKLSNLHPFLSDSDASDATAEGICEVIAYPILGPLVNFRVIIKHDKPNALIHQRVEASQ
jgi:hypothetical protein